MISNRKIRLVVTEEQARILDSQSKICNWLYNHLLATAKDDYYNSSPLKNVALRLKEAYMRSFKQGNGLPKLRAWKKKWFSLLYDEPKKGFSINGRELQLSLGTNKEGKRLHVTVHMEDSPTVFGGTIKNLRITKDHKSYYAVFCIERPDKKPARRLKYWDRVIDRLKSKRDICLRKAKFIETYESMLNQTAIAQARKIIAWVMEKSGKYFKEVNESGTTKNCCFCGHKEKKEPNIRVFTCPNCLTTLSRDLNSAINIAKKENYLPRLGYVGDLSRTTYTVAWDYTRCSLKVQMN